MKKTSTKIRPKHHFDPHNKRSKTTLDFLYRITFNIENCPTDAYILYNLTSLKNIEEINDFIEIFLTKLFKFWPHHHLLNFLVQIMKQSKQISVRMYFLLKYRTSLVENKNKKVLVNVRDYLLKRVIEFWTRPVFKTTIMKISDYNNSSPVPVKTHLLVKYLKFMKEEPLLNDKPVDTCNYMHENTVTESNNVIETDGEVEGIIRRKKIDQRSRIVSRFCKIPTVPSQTFEGCLIHLATIPSLLLNQSTPLNYRNIFYDLPHSNPLPSLKPNIFTQSIILLEKLSEISSKLKHIDIPFRQYLLEIELEILNCQLSEPLFLLGNAKGIDFSNSKVMDSAKNVPFKVSFVETNFVETIEDLAKYRVELGVRESFLKQVYKLYEEGSIEGRLVVDRLFEQMSRGVTSYINTLSIEHTSESSLLTQNMHTQAAQTLSTIEPHPKPTTQSQTLHNTNAQIFSNSQTQNLKTNRSETLPTIQTHSPSTTKTRTQTGSKAPSVQSSFIKQTIIIKSGDLIQEKFCIALMKILNSLFITQSLKLKLFPYEIFFINANYGFVEFLENTLSVHSIKTTYGDLSDFFDSFESPINAKNNFLNSFTAYCLFTYLLQVKDRHNGNILIDTETGDLMHIDFGFILGQHPGLWLVESAPFKFTYEYSKIINVNEFKYLFLEGFKVLRKEIDFISRHFKSYGYEQYNEEIMGRLFIGQGEKEMEDSVFALVDDAFGNIRTGAYDSLQFYSEGYIK
ncbi:Phosphatidylinositol 4-kinase beta [Cucumispora dikerogammari]|nr:Phosphatidylinositol 4-kinase beta [Cucumispora dikerogammari]